MNRYLLSEEESSRIHIIKFIAIVFVVFIHSYSLEVNFAEGAQGLDLPKWLYLFEDCLSNSIARCAVPIFFLCSSILLFKRTRNYKDTIKAKVKSILIPYLFWNTFWIVVFIFLQNFSFTAAYFSGSHAPILKSSIMEWLGLYGLFSKYPQDYPLWFMRDMMVPILFFPIIEKLADRFPKQLMTISIAILLIPITFPLKDAIFWFCIGACIVKLQIHMDVLDKISIKSISLVYLLAIVVRTLIYENVQYDSIRTVIHSITIYIGVVFWIKISKYIYDNTSLRKKILALSKWTFFIYATHELTLTSIKKICIKLLPTTPIYLLIEYIFIPLIVMTGCIVIGSIFKKILPRLYTIVTGER